MNGMNRLVAAIVAGMMTCICVCATVGCSTTEDAEPVSEYVTLATEAEMAVESVYTEDGQVGVPETEPPVGVRFVAMDPAGRAGRIEGYTGVNRFVGEYTISRAGVLEIGALASTRRAGPPALMRFESQLLAALGRSTRLEGDGERWELRDGRGVTVVLDGPPRR